MDALLVLHQRPSVRSGPSSELCTRIASKRLFFLTQRHVHRLVLSVDALIVQRLLAKSTRDVDICDCPRRLQRHLFDPVAHHLAAQKHEI